MSIAEKFYTMEYGVAPEDPKEAVQWLERHHRRFEEFIGGAWVAPASGEYQTTSDPSNGETLAEVGFPEHGYDAKSIQRALEARKRRGEKVYTGAYMISAPSGEYAGMAKPAKRAWARPAAIAATGPDQVKALLMIRSPSPWAKRFSSGTRTLSKMIELF